MMKYVFSGVRSAGLLWMGAVALLSASAALVCEMPEYDFGKAPDSEVITHTFTLRNDGDRPVNILSVSASCGCTTSSATTNSLEPGGSTEIIARVALRGRSGAQRFPLRVRTDDPDQSLIMLTVMGTVLQHSGDISPAPISGDGRELILAPPAVISLAADAVAATSRVSVIVFGLPGCSTCEQVKRTIGPDLEAAFPQQYRLEFVDVSLPENAHRLVYWQERFKVWDNEPVSVLVGGRVYLAGEEAIRDGLLVSVQAAIEAGGDAEDGGDVPRGDGLQGVWRRMRQFTVMGVMLAGLVDSLNPCAISTLVFFMSALSVAHVRKRRLLIAGAGFVLASFVTYFALGFGLLGALRLLTGFQVLRQIVDVGMTALLLILAVISLRDALAYRRTGKASDVRLQLPERLKTRLHGLVRTGVRSHHIAVAGVLLGAAVTLIESVCTGQVYVPTLVLVVRAGRSAGHALTLLGLYNLMFVTPLIIVFALVYKGLETPALLKWSRANVVPGKLLMAALFVAMAVLIILW